MAKKSTSVKTETVVKKKTFSTKEKNDIIDKIIVARISLLINHPFFGNMASRLILSDATDWCPTLATDGRNFFYNLDFLYDLNKNEMEFCFGHEILHVVFDHIGRKGDKHPTIFNIAIDYAVNQILIDEKIGKPPSKIKIYQDNKYRGWPHERIYDDLIKKCQDKNGGLDLSKLGQGDVLDEHLGPDAPGEDDGSSNGKPKYTTEELEKIREEIREAIISAARSVGAGHIPGSINRVISDLLESKMNWRELIRLTIQSILKNNYSFMKPNRKSQHLNAVLPGIIYQDTIDVCVSFDMSGSITDEMSREMVSEVAAIMEEFEDFKLRIWSFDTKVYNYAEFTSDNSHDIYDYVPKGGGGTHFESNWEFMKENDIEPKKFIMFTDGEPGNTWGDPDYCDTLFVIHQRNYGSSKIVAPFGETTYYEK